MQQLMRRGPWPSWGGGGGGGLGGKNTGPNASAVAIEARGGVEGNRSGSGSGWGRRDDGIPVIPDRESLIMTGEGKQAMSGPNQSRSVH